MHHNCSLLIPLEGHYHMRNLDRLSEFPDTEDIKAARANTACTWDLERKRH